jgi:hypothetical protein
MRPALGDERGSRAGGFAGDGARRRGRRTRGRRGTFRHASADDSRVELVAPARPFIVHDVAAALPKLILRRLATYRASPRTAPSVLNRPSRFGRASDGVASSAGGELGSMLSFAILRPGSPPVSNRRGVLLADVFVPPVRGERAVGRLAAPVAVAAEGLWACAARRTRRRKSRGRSNPALIFHRQGLICRGCRRR